MRFSREGGERRLIGDLVLCGKLEINLNKVHKRSLKVKGCHSFMKLLRMEIL